MKKLLLMLVAVALVAGATAKKKETDKHSYYMNRAIEERDSGNYYNALRFLDLELLDNDKNGVAYAEKALASYVCDDLDAVFDAAEKALLYLPKKEKTMRAKVLTVRGSAYEYLGDSINGLENYTLAIKTDPTLGRPYLYRGMLYMQFDRYDDAFADLNQGVKLDPENSLGYVGLALVADYRGDHTEAIRQYSKAILLDSETPFLYYCRAVEYIKLEDYNGAIDIIISDIHNDMPPSAYVLNLLPDDQLPLIEAKLKAQLNGEMQDNYWYFLLAKSFENRKRYEEAAEYYKAMLALDPEDEYTYSSLAECYEEMGDYEQALQVITKALEMNPEASRLMAQQAYYTEFLGDFDGAIALLTDLIEEYPNVSYSYYRRGFVENLISMPEAALEDINMALKLEPDNIHALLTKGDLLRQKGDREGADACYRMILEIDTVPGDNSTAMYAFQALGDNEKAKAFMAEVLERYPDDAGNYYDAACLYSRMGEYDESMAYLRKAIEKGFARFAHIMLDDDLEGLRQTPEFQEAFPSESFLKK